jgi:hypothetical protein
LIRHISANSSVGKAINRELLDAEASLNEDDRALAHPGLVRARCIVAP